MIAAAALALVAPGLVHAAGPPTAPTAIEPTVAAPAGDPPASAAAPRPLGPDEVLLQGGGFVRGTILEVVPDVRVVILVDGSDERREIPFDQIVEVQRDKHRPATTWDAVPDPAPPPVVEPPSRGRPRIHLELTKPRPVTLFEVEGEIVASGYNASLYGMKFRSACAAPCDLVIDGSRGQEFFLGTGEGAMWTASRKFTLADKQGPVTIRVKPGSRGMRIAGAIFLGIGIGCTLGGGLLAIPKLTRTPGLILLAVGVPGLLAGIPMTVLGRTRYEWADRDPTDAP